MGKHSTCKGSLYTPKGGRFRPLHGSLCFYALRAFLPSVPSRAARVTRITESSSRREACGSPTACRPTGPSSSDFGTLLILRDMELGQSG